MKRLSSHACGTPQFLLWDSGTVNDAIEASALLLASDVSSPTTFSNAWRSDTVPATNRASEMAPLLTRATSSSTVAPCSLTAASICATASSNVIRQNSDLQRPETTVAPHALDDMTTKSPAPPQDGPPPPHMFPPR